MPRNNPAKSKITFGTKITLIIFGLFLFFVLLEVGLRIGGFILVSLQEYRNQVSIRQKGTYRILCLGESTTQNQWPPFLEEILNQRNTGIRFSVVDKGRAATNTKIILGQVESYLDEYHPHMVVAMMGANDYGRHMPVETPSSSRITLFLRSLRTYKLARLLWLHMTTKAKEIGLYKPQKGKHPLKERQSSLPIIGLKEAYAAQEENIKNEDTLKKNLEINPRNDRAYLGLGRLYLNQGKFQQADEWFKKALELNPRNGGAYLGLGRLYLNQEQFQQADEWFKKALELNPRNGGAYLELGWLYLKQRKFQQAEEWFRKGLESNPPDKSKLYGALAVIYEEIGQVARAQEYYHKANELRLSVDNPITTHSYHKLKEILDKRKIKLVCVQYPMWSVEPLKKIFEEQEGIIFVDNERIFKDAVKREGYKAYFTDMFAGDFGHCTPKGNRLLAENIANVILKEVFDK